MSVTIKDIAKVCDVSYSTVSRVLNGKNVRQNAKNDWILATAKALGYKPHNIARQLVTKESDTIGMIIPDVSNSHYSEITKSVQDYANWLGYQVLISNTDWDLVKEATARDSLLTKNVAGIIVMPVCDRSHLIFRSLDVPLVFLGTRTGEKHIDYVVMDNIQATMDATEYLIGRGCRTLAYIGRKISNYSSRDRMEGFLRAMKEHGLSREAIVASANSLEFPGGYAETKRLLTQVPRPDGLIVFNDQLAFSVMAGIISCGYAVGRDVLVVSFDDLQISALPQISLTTITPSKEELGRVAVDLILRRQKEPEAERKAVIVSSKMVKRATG